MAANDRKRMMKARPDGLSLGPVPDAKADLSPAAKRQKKANLKLEMLESPASTPKPRVSEPKVKGNGGAAAPRKRVAGVDGADGSEVSGSAALNANHNKYCHFCQHVKVRASSMLACENQECCRRFCEHCLITHINEDVNPLTSSSFEVLNGRTVWYCPICREKCCCSVADCKQDHRHCKAYRYRRRRAELASKRMSGSSEGRRAKKSSSKAKAIASASVAAKTSDTESAADTPPAWGGSTGSAPSGKSWERHQEAPAEPEEPARCSSSGLSDSGEEEQDTFASGLWGSQGNAVANKSSHVRPAVRSAKPFPDTVEHSAGMEFNIDDGVQAGDELDDAEELDDGFDGDAFGSMYGQMFSIPAEYETSLGDDFADRLVGLTNGTEVDEAQWLRRTYETVYNPVARQRALNNLVSGTGTSVKKAPKNQDLFGDLGSFDRPAVPARKATVMYDFV